MIDRGIPPEKIYWWMNSTLYDWKHKPDKDVKKCLYPEIQFAPLLTTLLRLFSFSSAYSLFSSVISSKSLSFPCVFSKSLLHAYHSSDFCFSVFQSFSTFSLYLLSSPFKYISLSLIIPCFFPCFLTSLLPFSFILNHPSIGWLAGLDS